MNKICTKCKSSLNIDEFPIVNGKTKKRSSMCLTCKREYDREYHKKYAEKRNELKRKTQLKNRLRNRKFIVDYLKENPCVDCGENDFIVLEFDHKYDKKFNLADAARRGYSLKTIKKEIEKCDVVCANCHRRRTAKQFNYYIRV
jgi:hypothetical protein